MAILKEGGNVFKNADGAEATIRINKADVIPTVRWLEGLTGLKLVDNMLGTTGKNPTSGDLDLAVDASKVTKEELVGSLMKWAVTAGVDPKTCIKKTGDSVHFKTPIKGDEKRGFVQTDFMFGDPKWQHFAMQGGTHGSPFKGMHRHLLMASVAKAQGMKWSYKRGLLNRADDAILSQEPDEIAKLLLGKQASKKDIKSVESIMQAIKDRPDYETLVQDFRDALTRDATGPQINAIKEGSGEWFWSMKNLLSESQVQESINNLVIWVKHNGVGMLKEKLYIFQNSVGGYDYTLEYVGGPKRGTSERRQTSYKEIADELTHSGWHCQED